MKSYNIGDDVYFYISVSCENTYEGKITEIIRPDVYLIKHDNGMYEVHGQFVTGLVIPDKEIIHNLEARILNDDKKLQVLTKRIVEADAKIEELKKKVAKQKDEIDELRRDVKKSWRGIFDDDENILRKIPRRSPRWTIPADKKLTCCKNSYNLEH
jgi:DNA repair exonuclease SbcCD ATPase subunit